MSGPSILEVRDLVLRYEVEGGMVSAVEDVSFSMPHGKSLGLVGESGCGKTSVALALLRLQAPNARVLDGEILLDGENLLALDAETMRTRRWRKISMVFQGAMSSWNPVQTVGDQIREAMELHWEQTPTHAEMQERLVELFALVGLDTAMIDRYPHEYSGGMRQRAGIALALSCDPILIVADEPTTALDVIVQSQILDEMRNLQDEMGMSIIYISHDIAAVAETTDLIAVMYAGKLVETGPTRDVFTRPLHPYTWLILTSTPSIAGPRRQLAPIEGEPPDLVSPPTGCRFHPRCPFATDLCANEEPPLVEVSDGRSVACWHSEKVPIRVGGTVE